MIRIAAAYLAAVIALTVAGAGDASGQRADALPVGARVRVRTVVDDRWHTGTVAAVRDSAIDLLLDPDALPQTLSRGSHRRLQREVPKRSLGEGLALGAIAGIGSAVAATMIRDAPCRLAEFILGGDNNCAWRDAYDDRLSAHLVLGGLAFGVLARRSGWVDIPLP